MAGMLNRAVRRPVSNTLGTCAERLSRLGSWRLQAGRSMIRRPVRCRAASTYNAYSIAARIALLVYVNYGRPKTAMSLIDSVSP
jgi:hypothetical protein